MSVTCGSHWLPESHRLGLVLLLIAGQLWPVSQLLQASVPWWVEEGDVFSSQCILKTSVVEEGMQQWSFTKEQGWHGYHRIESHGVNGLSCMHMRLSKHFACRRFNKMSGNRPLDGM